MYNSNQVATGPASPIGSRASRRIGKSTRGETLEIAGSSPVWLTSGYARMPRLKQVADTIPSVTQRLPGG